MNVGKIIVSNRTKKKAEEIKKNFPYIEVLDWGNIVDTDMIINATSLGLKK
jgi:shikimate dehydrogenase